jgi:tetratricopeptide (TPR) repeat protein
MKYHIPVLLILVLAVFSNTLANGFVWDDNIFMLTNTAYRTFDLKKILFSLGNGVEYLPVRDLTHAIEFLFLDKNPAGFHLDNILIYGMTVIAVYLFTLQLMPFLKPATRDGDDNGAVTAFLVALLFAMHPVHSEVAAWITGRNTLLSGMFFFLSCASFTAALKYDHAKRSLLNAASFALFILAIFSKATAIALPLVLLLITLLGRRKLDYRNTVATAPFFLAAIASAFLFHHIGRGSGVIEEAATIDSIISKLAVAGQIPFFYISQLIDPTCLAAEYEATFSHSLTTPVVLLCGAGIVALLAASYLLRHRFSPFYFSIGWFFLTLIPVLNFFRTYPVVADRYEFIPSFALCFLLATPAMYISRQRLAFHLAPLAAIAIFWGVLTFDANAVWRSDETVWTNAVKVSPHSAQAHYHLGRTYYQMNRIDEAMKQFEAAQAMAPYPRYFDYFRGYFSFLRGDYHAAVMYFEQTLAWKADYVEALYHMGQTLDKMGRTREAEGYYLRVLQSQDFDEFSFKVLARERLGRRG